MLNLRSGRVRRSALAILSVLVAVFAAHASGQTPTLAEVARKEQERRKAQKVVSKVYTKKDLPASAQGRGGASASEATPTPAAPSSDAKPGSKAAEDPKGEAWWRDRITRAREDLRRNEVFAEALQTRINSLSADFVNRDDPFQRAKIGEDRDKALSELARVKAEIEGTKKQIEDIEEEARKGGVPPGWLR
jgi:hypothetical protein